MVLASQFNSFIQFVIVMVAQPLAIIGGVIALWATGHMLNMLSMIGLVLMMYLVVKNPILLVVLPAVYSLVEGAIERRNYSVRALTPTVRLYK
jgi:multidrug efflux pump subunit AcrB